MMAQEAKLVIQVQLLSMISAERAVLAVLLVPLHSNGYS
jgi:hypothetical protein